MKKYFRLSALLFISLGFLHLQAQTLNCSVTASKNTICAGESVMLTASAEGSFAGGNNSGLPLNLLQGLVGYWPFNGNANDQSGNGNNGTVNGAVLSGDRFGTQNSCYLLDETSDNINFGNNPIFGLTGQTTLTVSYWFKAFQNSGAFSIYKYDNGYAENSNYGILGARAVTVNGTGTTVVDSRPLGSDWELITITFQAGINNTKIYSNGQLVASGTGVYNQIVSSSPLAINYCPGIQNYTRGLGYIDDFTIWNRTLSSNEIRQLANSENYLWSNGATTPSITVSPTANTTYSCTITSGSQTCTADKTIAVKQPSSIVISAAIIEGQTYSFNGQTLTQAGIYNSTLQNASGCDSVITLTLTVNPVPLNCSVTASKNTICAGESVTLTASVSGSSASGNNSGLPINLQQGLVAYYPFNGNANDESGNGNHGQAFGSPTFVQGVQGQGLKLNGINSAGGSGNPDRIRVPNSASLQFSNKMSVAYWVKIDGNQVQTPMNCSGSAIPGISGTVLAKSGDRFGIYFSEYETGSGFGVNPYYGGVGGSVNGLSSVYQNYRHVVYSVDNNNISIYINGVLRSVSIGSVNYNLANNQDLNIGVQNNSGGACLTYWYPINGVLDEIGIWNRTLSASEVQQLYAPTTVSYLWSTGETTASINSSPTANSTYSCTITSGTQSCTAETAITVKQQSTNAISAAITEGQGYSFNGQSLNEAGTYTATLQNAAGCDSVVTLTLTVNPLPLNCSITASASEICNGDNILLTINSGSGILGSESLPSGFIPLTEFNGKRYYLYDQMMSWQEAKSLGDSYNLGMYVVNNASEEQAVYQSLPNIGTDGIHYWLGLYQDLNDPEYSEPSGGWKWVDGTRMENGYTNWMNGEPNDAGGEHYGQFEWDDDGIQWNDAGLPALNGTQISKPIYERPITQDFNYLWSNGATTPSITVSPTANTTYSCTITSGTQTCTAEKAIAVKQPSTSSESENACDSYTWNGQTYTQSGTYTWSGTNAAGCDSTATLNLTITPSSSNTTTASACGSYTWSVNGQSYTESGSYNFVNGCNTEILNLTITPSGSNSTTASACDSYTWSVNGQTYTNSGTYSIANGCYSEELRLTINLSSQAPTGIQASATQINGGTPVTLSIQGGNLGTSAVWKWYTSSCGGTLVGNGPSISVSPSLTTTYYVRAEGTCNTTNCQSVTITVNTSSTCGDGRYAEQVVSFNQKKAINETAVALGRSQSNKALCAPQNNATENFVSLGFGGDITLKFGKAIRNGAGNDIRVYETTFGNLSCNAYPEKARVFASQDGCRFVYLGEICQDGSVDLGALNWAQYVRIVDVSSKTAVYQSGGTPDGYDVDAVEALNGFETNPSVDAIAGGASEVKSYLPGKCRGGANILVSRTDKNKALGVPQGTDVVNYVSLGFGGSITLRFKYAVENNPSGLDLQVVETSYGNPSCNSYPEKARFEGSIDGITWTDLGQLCLDGKLEMGTLPYLHLLRITDESDKTKFGSSADGFDVDGVVAINQCTSSNTREAVEIVDDINTSDELELAGILELYPNPASESATFSFSSQNASPYDLKIVNALGQIVYSTEGLATEGANNIELNLEYLSKGLYIVHLLQDGYKQQVSLVKK